tara:strand:+ start:3100 stop:3531 length:432 start_codon:yes stop_codon:yes gene_type:complete
MVLNCRSVIETKEFAFKMAESIPAGKVIALLGNLGSGKTTFSQGFAEGLNVIENVGSPTFKLISEYNGYPHNLFHIDCYRIKDIDDFFNIGGERYLAPENAVTLIEWADIIGEVLPQKTIIINFYRIKTKPDGRKIEIEGWDG